MNIEKLARHLKEFTLDEIEMIAECDCKNELEQLLNTNKIVFEQGVFKIKELTTNINYGVFENLPTKNVDITVSQAAQYFLQNYVSKFCKSSTYRNYKCFFKFEIIPFFKRRTLNSLEIKDIKEFYENCVNRDLSPRRTKNILALLNQLLKYFQNLVVIDKNCIFQVKRITSKNEFNINRITFNTSS